MRPIGPAVSLLLVCASCGSGGGGGGDGGSPIRLTPLTIPLPGLASFFQSPALAYVDGDGALDLGVGALGNGEVDVLFGDGEGGFELQAPIQAGLPGDSSEFVRPAFLDLDPFVDLVVSDMEDGTLQTYLGRGDGTFDPVLQVPLSLPDDVVDIAVGRLDGDVLDDVVVAYTNFVQPMLSVGGGLLVDSISTFMVPGVTDVALGDAIGNDDVLDIVACTPDGALAHVMEGNGDGTFAFPISFPVPEEPQAAAVFRIPAGIGVAIVFATRNPVGARVYLLDVGPTYLPSPQGHLPLPGTFAGAVDVLPISSPLLPASAIVTTVSGEETFVSRLDFVVPTPTAGEVTVATDSFTGVARGPAVGDVDGDGLGDLVYACLLPSSFGSQLVVWLSD